MSRAAYLTIRTACVTVELRWTACQSEEVCVFCVKVNVTVVFCGDLVSKAGVFLRPY